MTNTATTVTLTSPLNVTRRDDEGERVVSLPRGGRVAVVVDHGDEWTVIYQGRYYLADRVAAWNATA